MGLYVEVNLARNVGDDLYELALRRQYDTVIDETNEQAATDWGEALALLAIAQDHLFGTAASDPRDAAVNIRHFLSRLHYTEDDY